MNTSEDLFMESCMSSIGTALSIAFCFACVSLSDTIQLWSYSNGFPSLLLQGAMLIGIFGSVVVALLLTMKAIIDLYKCIQGRFKSHSNNKFI